MTAEVTLCAWRAINTEHPSTECRRLVGGLSDERHPRGIPRLSPARPARQDRSKSHEATRHAARPFLGYTPGVAQPVLEIDQDPRCCYGYTAKGNLVGAVSNGTAILRLGNRGADRLCATGCLNRLAAWARICADQAPVAQWIEHCPPEAGAGVRIAAGALTEPGPFPCGAKWLGFAHLNRLRHGALPGVPPR